MNEDGLPPAPPLLPKGVGDLLNAAFTLYKLQWGAFFKIVAIIAIPLSIVQYGVVYGLITGGGAGRAITSGLLFGLIGVLISATLTGAITRASAGAVVGRAISVEESYAYGLKRLGSIIWVGLLFGLLVGLGFIALVIPGLFLLVKLAVSLPALVVEDKRGSQALGRSWDLTTGYFWHVAGTVVLAFLITGVVSSVIQALFVAGGWFIQALAAAAAQIVTAPFTALVTVLIYLDLRARKEALTSERLRSELATSG